MKESDFLYPILFLLTAALGVGMVASLLIGCEILIIPVFKLSGNWIILAIVSGIAFLMASILDFKTIYDGRKDKVNNITEEFKIWRVIFIAVSIISGWLTVTGLLAGFEICPVSMIFLGLVTTPVFSPFFCFLFAGCFGGVFLTYSICSIISVRPEKVPSKTKPRQEETRLPFKTKE